MIHFFYGLLITLILANTALAGGRCISKNNNPNDNLICNLSTSEDLCSINSNCQWIPEKIVGVCRAQPNQMFSNATCKLNKDINFCRMNPSCRWIEFDADFVAELCTLL